MSEEKNEVNEVEETKVEKEYPEFGGKLPKDEFAFEEVDYEGRLKDKPLMKKMTMIHKFTYQDIISQIEVYKSQKKGLKKQRDAINDQINSTDDSIALWVAEKKTILKQFPEIRKEEKELAAKKVEADSLPAGVEPTPEVKEEPEVSDE